MKKFLIPFFTLFAVALFFGHPPSGADFKFDASSDAKASVLTVNIAHSIKDSKINDMTKHFVKEVTLSVNGKQVEKQTFSKQDSIDGQVVKFKVNLKEGDKVSVNAACSLNGTKTIDYVIQKK